MGSPIQATRAYTVLNNLGVFDRRFSLSICRTTRISDHRYTLLPSGEMSIVDFPSTDLPDSHYENTFLDKPSLKLDYSDVPVDFAEDKIGEVCFL